MTLVIYLIGKVVIAQGAIENYEMGIHAGVVLYQGDLTPSAFGSYKTIRFVAGLHGNIVLSGAFSLRPNLDFGHLEGDDSKYNDRVWRQQRNFKFERSFNEISALLVWDIFGKNREYFREGFSPYLVAGIGYTIFKGNRDYSNFHWSYFSNQPEVTAGLNSDIARPELKGTPVLPFGFGVRYSLSPRISVNAETSYRLTTTDYIDGFSLSADTKQMDRYYTYTFGLIFSPWKKSSEGIKCPAINN